MTKTMRVLVVGGTGTLGRQISKRAVDAGYQVRCMVRSPRKAGFLQEWGCELTQGDLLDRNSLDYALEDVAAIIDTSTSRPDETKSVYETDWEGKLNLFNAAEKAKVKRVIYLSLLASEKYREVPLMDIKYCTENLLIESDLNYTILQGAAFMQGVIGQFAIPILDSQTVWVSGNPTKVAYMNTQDVARFAISALEKEETYRKVFPVVGPKAWSPQEVIKLCEKSTGKNAKVIRVSPFLIDIAQKLVSFFEPTVHVAERLSFAEVTGSGETLDASMDETYKAFDIDPGSITTLEKYIEEYYQMIIKRLREMEADLDKESRKKLPF